MNDVFGNLLVSEILNVIDEEDQYCYIVGVKAMLIVLDGMGSGIDQFCYMIFGDDEGEDVEVYYDGGLLNLFWPTNRKNVVN